MKKLLIVPETVVRCFPRSDSYLSNMQFQAYKLLKIQLIISSFYLILSFFIIIKPFSLLHQWQNNDKISVVNIILKVIVSWLICLFKQKLSDLVVNICSDLGISACPELKTDGTEPLRFIDFGSTLEFFINKWSDAKSFKSHFQDLKDFLCVSFHFLNFPLITRCTRTKQKQIRRK